MLTQSELKSQLHYDHETGIFTRLVANSNRVKVGEVAGGKKNTGYIYFKINCKLYLAHRLAWLYVYGEFPVNFIDHINGIKDDNRIKNLRGATYQQNSFNRDGCKNKTSLFKGVSWSKASKKWKANATLKGKSYYLGLFNLPELASQAYQYFATKHHGEFYHDS